MALEEVARTDELDEGQMTHVIIGSQDILLAKVEGTVYAMDNRCGHLGTLLHEGDLDRGIVECPGHKIHYNVTTGEYVGARNFTNYDREVFPVIIEDGVIKLDVPVKESPAG